MTEIERTELAARRRVASSLRASARRMARLAAVLDDIGGKAYRDAERERELGDWMQDAGRECRMVQRDLARWKAAAEECGEQNGEE